MQAVKKPSGIFLCSTRGEVYTPVNADDMATALFTYAKEQELGAGAEVTVIKAAELQTFILTDDPEEQEAVPSE